MNCLEFNITTSNKIYTKLWCLFIILPYRFSIITSVSCFVYFSPYNKIEVKIRIFFLIIFEFNIKLFFRCLSLFYPFDFVFSFFSRSRKSGFQDDFLYVHRGNFFMDKCFLVFFRLMIGFHLWEQKFFRIVHILLTTKIWNRKFFNFILRRNFLRFFQSWTKQRFYQEVVRSFSSSFNSSKLYFSYYR